MLNKAERDRSITGISFSDQGPSIHHMLFADDSFFLCKAAVNEVTYLNGILKEYGEAAGQIINLNKSSITFGANLEDDVKVIIREITDISNEGGPGSYLGLPEYFSGSKIQMLFFIQERLKNRMSGWFSRILSQGG